MKNGLITAIMGWAILLLGGPMACFLGAQEEVQPVNRQHTKAEFKVEVKEAQPEAVAWLGIYMSEINGALRHVLELKEKQGVLISEIIKYSPADKAKLAKYDIILKLDKETINGIGDLQAKLSEKKPDTEITLTVLRKHKEITIPVVLGAKPPQGDGFMGKFMKAKHKPEKKTWLGIVPKEIGPAMRNILNLKDKEGILVEKVFEDSPAAKAKLEQYDIILKLDGEAVKNSGDLTEKIMARKAGEEVTLDVLRNGKKIDVIAVLEGKSFQERDWYQKTDQHMPKFLKSKTLNMREYYPGGKRGQGMYKIKIMPQFEGMDEEDMEFEENFEIEDMDDVEEMMKFLEDMAKRFKSKEKKD